jgi:hypothetical protein
MFAVFLLPLRVQKIETKLLLSVHLFEVGSMCHG